MSREMRRCVVTGDVFPDGRKHGYGCPHHTDLRENGGRQTQDQLRNYYHDRRDEYPYGRYCCGFCREHQEIVTVSNGHSSRTPKSGGRTQRYRTRSATSSPRTGKRIATALVMSVLFAFGFAVAEQAWILGAIIGVCVGFWFKAAIKIALALLVVVIIIAILAALLN